VARVATSRFRGVDLRSLATSYSIERR